MRHVPRSFLWLVLSVAVFTACDDGGSPPFVGPPGGSGTLSIPADGGDGQIGDPGEPLPSVLRVVVTSDGRPAVGVAVRWSTADGTIAPAESTTGATGAAVAAWTLPDTAGVAEVARATAGLASGGRAVEFVAFAVPADHAVVEVADGGFEAVRPSNPLRVPAGTTVTWMWAPDARDHNVAPTGGGTEPARSGAPVDGPAVYSFRFDTPGTYPYACETHPADVGEVVVEGP